MSEYATKTTNNKTLTVYYLANWTSIYFPRIRSAPLCAQTKRGDRHDSHSSTEGRREAWLHTRVSKMSLDSETTSFSNQSECSDSGSDGEDVLRPFVRKEFRKFRGSSGESCESSKETQSSSDSSRVSLRRQYHRPQSGVKNASFWSVLRQNQNSRPSVVEEGEESKPRNSLAKKAKDVMIEQRVLKLFIGVDKLKNSRVKLPDIWNICQMFVLCEGVSREMTYIQSTFLPHWLI